MRPLRGSRFALRQPAACGVGECDRAAGEVVEVPVAVRAVRHPDNRGAEGLAVRRGVVARQPERAGVDKVVELAAEGLETVRLLSFLLRSERICDILSHVVLVVLYWLCNSKYTKNDAFFSSGMPVSPAG